MSKIPAPQGRIAAGKKSALTGPRESAIRYGLLSRRGTPLGDLKHVSGGTLEWNANSQVKGGGRLIVADPDDPTIRTRIAKDSPLVYQDSFHANSWAGWTYVGDHPENSVLVPDPTRYRETPSSKPEDVSSVFGDIPFAAWDWSPGDDVRRIEFRNFGGLAVGNEYTIFLDVSCLNQTTGTTEAVTLTPHTRPGLPEWDYEPGGDPGGAILDSPILPWTTIRAHFYVDSTARASGVGFNLELDTPQGEYTTLLVRALRVYVGRLGSVPRGSAEVVGDIWPSVRIRPRVSIDGVGATQLGVFLPSAPTADHDGETKSWDIDLLDRTSVLAECAVDQTTTVKKADNVVDFVWSMIRQTGEQPGAKPSFSSLGNASLVMGDDMTWAAGTSVLTIINEALDSCGFMALRADGDGVFRLEPYVRPKNRPIAWEFVDGSNCIYLPRFTVEKDTYSVPNKVIMIAQPNEPDEPPMVAVAENRNPASPLSYESRLRWVTDVQRGVEAATLKVLEDKAQRRLSDLSSVQGTVTIQHGYVPGLRVNNVVRFRRKPAGINGKYVVTKMTMPLDPTELCKTTLTEVIDL